MYWCSKSAIYWPSQMNEVTDDIYCNIKCFSIGRLDFSIKRMSHIYLYSIYYSNVTKLIFIIVWPMFFTIIVADLFTIFHKALGYYRIDPGATCYLLGHHIELHFRETYFVCQRCDMCMVIHISGGINFFNNAIFCYSITL